MPKNELFTAFVPKINIGTYRGNTIKDKRILFDLKLIVNAAAIEPIKVSEGVPTSKLRKRMEDV